MEKLLMGLILISQLSFAETKSEIKAETKPKEPALVAEGCNKTQGWGYFCKFNLEFAVKQQVTAVGKIGAIEPVSVDAKMSQGVLLKLKTGSQIVEFLLGPEWYINNLDEVLVPGDEVVIRGMQGYFQGNLWNRVSRLQRGERFIEFISTDGRLAWSAWQPSPKEQKEVPVQKKSPGKPKKPVKK